MEKEPIFGELETNTGTHSDHSGSYTPKEDQQKRTKSSIEDLNDATRLIGVRFVVTPEMMKNKDLLKRLVDRFDNSHNNYVAGSILLDSDDEKDHRDAIRYLKKAADKGHADATHLLGSCYYKGKGTDIDIKKGVELFLLSADLGSLPGKYSAGNELLYGKNVKTDYPRAYGYLKEAADSGDERAINSLAIMYLHGLYVSPNYRKAKRLFRKAAKLGDPSARYNLKQLKFLGKDYDFSSLPIHKGSPEQKEVEE